MTIRHLKIFVTVCQEGSITAAAGKLYLTQPSVSASIKELETHYGQKLFDRYSRKLHITPFGIEVLYYAQQVIDSYNKLESFSDNYTVHDRIRLGTGTTIGNMFMADIISSFHREYPHVDIEVTIERTSLYPEYLINNTLDFVIVEQFPYKKGILSFPLCSFPVVGVCHKDHPFAQKDEIVAEDFLHVPVLAMEKNIATRIMMDTFFESHNIQINPVWKSIDVSAILHAIGANLGVGFLSTNHIKAAGNPDLVQLHVRDFVGRSFINVYYHKNKTLSSISRIFIDHCANRLKERGS